MPGLMFTDASLLLGPDALGPEQPGKIVCRVGCSQHGGLRDQPRDRKQWSLNFPSRTELLLSSPMTSLSVQPPKSSPLPNSEQAGDRATNMGHPRDT